MVIGWKRSYFRSPGTDSNFRQTYTGNESKHSADEVITPMLAMSWPVAAACTFGSNRN